MSVLESILYVLGRLCLDVLRERGYAIEEIPSADDLARDRREREWLRQHPREGKPDDRS